MKLRPEQFKEVVRESAFNVARANGLKAVHTEQFKKLAVETLEKVSDALTERTNVAIAAGIEKEKQRLGTIMRSSEAKGREKMALELAVESDILPDKVLSILRSSPMAARGPSELSLAMQQATPGISSDGPDPDPTRTETDDAVQAILNAE